MEDKREREIKKPGFFLAVLPLIFMFVVLIVGLLIFSVDIKILLLICAAFTICLCMYLGYTWKDIEKEIVEKLAAAFPAILILICVGLMIGAWIVSGTIPFLVYIGLQIISPKYIIITSFLVTTVLSVSTELMGIRGNCRRGTDQCGSGDGRSPSGSRRRPLLQEHISGIKCRRSQTAQICLRSRQARICISISDTCFYTTIPGFIISCIVYVVAGAHLQAAERSHRWTRSSIRLQNFFNLSMPVGLLLLIPPVIVVQVSLMKKPTIPVMIISSIVAVILAMAVQGFSFATCATSMVSGFTMDLFPNLTVDLNTIPEQVSNLLQRGGMSSMMNTTLMAFCAFSFIGALTVCGSMDIILERLTKHIHNTGSLLPAQLRSA